MVGIVGRWAEIYLARPYGGDGEQESQEEGEGGGSEEEAHPRISSVLVCQALSERVAGLARLGRCRLAVLIKSRDKGERRNLVKLVILHWEAWEGGREGGSCLFLIKLRIITDPWPG